MPSDILKGGNETNDAIVTILGRLGLWEVPHLENVCSLYTFSRCRTSHRLSLPSMITMASTNKF